MRNAVGDVIQFLYGEDGMDGAAIESQKIDALKATEVRNMRCGADVRCVGSPAARICKLVCSIASRCLEVFC